MCEYVIRETKKKIKINAKKKERKKFRKNTKYQARMSRVVDGKKTWLK